MTCVLGLDNVERRKGFGANGRENWQQFAQRIRSTALHPDQPPVRAAAPRGQADHVVGRPDARQQRGALPEPAQPGFVVAEKRNVPHEESASTTHELPSVNEVTITLLHAR